MNKFEIFQHNCTPPKEHQISATTISDLLHYKPQRLHVLHRINFYVMLLFTTGSGRHQVDFDDVNVIPGHMLFVAKGQMQSFDPLETYDGFGLMFTEEFFCRDNYYRELLNKTLLYNDPLQLSYFDVGERFEELKAAFQYIIEEQKRPAHELQELLLHNYLVNMMLIAETKHNARQKTMVPAYQNLLIIKFKDLVDKHLSEQWPIAIYAKKLNVTQRTLENAFMKAEDTTPKKWLTDRLVLEIKRLLTHENVTIKEIADYFGFKELTNFVKFFKKGAGVTPAAFRQSLRS
ncbi:AraC family transcriptional regulator [Niabella beijingensis]|uniref:AraC family transcriptional regulator n=1 Tax=Niabella beijingensis TaxID=2872700 RepID=UPI001CBE912C|nr:AraC family transcriptional regulator [Niabella beijingensis]MBZ4189410.1 AraC family transcriptional regulator [Niabella beijingensis]